jgi:hypothetical protein
VQLASIVANSAGSLVTGNGGTPWAAGCIRNAPGAHNQDRDLISSMSFQNLACTTLQLFMQK